MMSYPKQNKSNKAVTGDMRRFSRTAKRTKKCNINPRVMRGGIRL